jgi:hypothetical protein
MFLFVTHTQNSKISLLATADEKSDVDVHLCSTVALIHNTVKYPFWLQLETGRRGRH